MADADEDFEIEVTPEMIEAGKAVCDWNPRLGGEDDTVTNVFNAMLWAMSPSNAARALRALQASIGESVMVVDGVGPIAAEIKHALHKSAADV